MKRQMETHNGYRMDLENKWYLDKSIFPVALQQSKENQLTLIDKDNTSYLIFANNTFCQHKFLEFTYIHMFVLPR